MIRPGLVPYPEDNGAAWRFHTGKGQYPNRGLLRSDLAGLFRANGVNLQNGW